jgi:hypothetical protein
MNDLRDQLENLRRRQSPTPGAFDRFARLRDRRQRNRRVAAGVVGGSLALLLVAGIAFEWKDVHRDGTSSVLSPATAPRLQRTWSATVGPHATAPVVAGGRIFVAASGRLTVFDATCEVRPTCPPVWTATLPPDAIPAAPVVGDGMVVVSAGDLFAFDVSCRDDGGACPPMWRAQAPPPRTESTVGFSAPLLSGGMVYVGASDGLRAYAEGCGSGGETCDPLWVGRGRSGAASPVTSGSTVVIGSHLKLSAYPNSCPGRACDPIWTAPMPQNSESDAVVAADGLLYVDSMALPGRCGPGSCEPVHTLVPDVPTSRDLGATRLGPVTPGVGLVYASATRLYAFPTACGASGRCEPIWRGPQEANQVTGQPWEWSQPTLGDGLVFSSTDRISAFDRGCVGRGDTCRALWTGPSSDGLRLSRVAVSASSVFVTTASGDLVAFGLR